MNSEICPLCRGSGKYVPPAPYGMSGMLEPMLQTCHACQGKGIVWPPDTRTLFIDRGWPVSVPGVSGV